MVTLSRVYEYIIYSQWAHGQAVLLYNGPMGGEGLGAKCRGGERRHKSIMKCDILGVQGVSVPCVWSG